jgi:BioD-like phosphotransacetylase family protein
MAKGLYIGATRAFSGKNMLSAGLGLNLRDAGLRIGYMKPVGTLPVEKNGLAGDEDAFFIQEVLGLDSPPHLVTPIMETQDFKMRAFGGQDADYMPKIAWAYEQLSRTRDLMLVCGAGHAMSGKYCRLDGVRLVRELKLKALLVDRPRHEVNHDELMTLKELLGDSLVGVVLNGVPFSFMSDIESVIKPCLERNGIPVLGIIPADPLMGSIRARELAEGLGGRLVAAQGRAEGMVENFLIGTMQVENFTSYFRRHPNAAVIVGGDRADVQLVAIEGNCPCLVLTGNLLPNDILLSRADTLGVPIVIVRQDTYAVAKKMEALLNRHKMRDDEKTRQSAALVGNNVNIAALRGALDV